ncbi:MAG: hypothetical protein QW666_03600 [Candidatus Woesearchaeota archaeon]
MKKAQGLPITTIVIAALALAVLFILLYAVLNKLGYFGRGVNETSAMKECPPGQNRSVYDCERPLLGDYGKRDASGKLVPLGFNEVCCEK